MKGTEAITNTKTQSMIRVEKWLDRPCKQDDLSSNPQYSQKKLHKGIECLPPEYSYRGKAGTDPKTFRPEDPVHVAVVRSYLKV